ncbi:LysE family translocator [Belnapia rosea]|uniref:Threonine/homoserine/homoserine lactone efflux protein n=1 Tax=Belnapia rosea TaxID=938405 RepID=A0A1G6LBH9_9PROT|nr:LysE family transporter [Belnapia rosea]SDC40095.1 Threonine/homoserine/homoserine lactone efflux protein [Belnapia rosea]
MTVRDFLLAYLAILVTPGPNLLVVAGVAALRGLRGALPLCLGIALGAGTLNAAMGATLGAAPLTPDWSLAGRLLSAAMLLWVAFSIARAQPPDAVRAAHRAQGAEFGAGFCTAVTNPITAAFFAAQFLGPLSQGGDLRLLAPLAVAATALAVSLGCAALLAQPACQRAALAWHRPIRLIAAITLVLMATSILVSSFA